MPILNCDTLIADCLETAFEIKKYTEIIESVAKEDFKATSDFRKNFNGFYRVRQRSVAWYNCYYKLMEKRSSSFDFVLQKMYEDTNRIEPSFSSKLVSAVNPELPIWDKYVLENLGLKMEWDNCQNQNSEIRLKKAIEIYGKILLWYDEYIKSDSGKNCIEKFDEVLPKYKDKLTSVKKIDYLLWSKR